MSDHLYEVFVADTEFSKAIHFNLRYQVYCEQRCYESPNDVFVELEMDEWDDQSVHFILRDRVTGEWSAALRLIRPYEERKIPIEKFGQIDDESAAVSRHKTVEMSRLCKARSESENNKSANEKSFLESAIATLIVSAAHYCKDNGFDNLLCLTSRSVSRMMSRQWTLNAVGPVIEHRGKRKPYWVDLDSILKSSISSTNNTPYRHFSNAFGGPVSCALFV